MYKRQLLWYAREGTGLPEKAKRGAGLGPVSYTHLDVYKRQFQYALQTAAGQLLQAVGHGGHAEEEGSDSPDEGDHVRYIHLSASKSDFSVKLR